jgi:hypothetical protein
MDNYDLVFDIMTNALKEARKANISNEDLLPPLIDLVTIVSLLVGKEAATRSAINRIENRINDWKAGTFPIARSQLQ